MKRLIVLGAAAAIIVTSFTIRMPSHKDEVSPALSIKAAPVNAETNHYQLASAKVNGSTEAGAAITAEKPPSASIQTVDIPIYLNGTLVEMQEKPMISAGSTLVPLRSVFTAMGIEVTWENSTRTVIVRKDGSELELKPGEKTAILQGKRIELATPGQIMNGSTYVPLRFIGESFGSLVGYDANSRTISISTLPYKKGKVVYIVDGDTLDVKLNSGETIRVRLIGVNTPESTKKVEVGGKEAAAYTKKRLSGKTVFITQDKTNDPYGRTLAYVHLANGEFFNATLVSEGYARVMTIEPNTTWAAYYEDLQVNAQKGQRQIWNPATYKGVDPVIANDMIAELAEAGITKSANHLGTSTTESEFANLLLFTLFPEARILMTGYKVYQIGTDEATQKIIQTLFNKGSANDDQLLDNQQMRKLTLMALGVEEGSFVTNTLDNLGLIPQLERPVTVGEATEMVSKLKSFMPAIDGLKGKVEALQPDIEKLHGLKGYVSDSGLQESIKGTLGGLEKLNLTDKAKSAGEWLKDSIGELFGKKPTNEDAKTVIESTKEKVEDIKGQISDDAFRIIDQE
ncbi:stalk domain-containing protein [Paenibacillus abyssi]|uniref:TNase-like domain-containing protein n=1 Tax=Paenibacillus abyssi TaxID=1340531 RepID=A0A917LEV1_9BACL|nr:stalk domain-containing protein [Paenibacillus abyssi]GGG17607.1 hypothetical protein GCM10010916_38050 [Paenibacillus abyssi]